MTKQTFLQGTLILIVAGMITRFLGFINRIGVARMMGEEGVGLYMMAVPTLFLAITLTQLRLPIAISKRVAEAEANGDQTRVKSILVVSLIITAITSVVFTIALIMTSQFIATTLLIDDITLIVLLFLCPINTMLSLFSL